MTALLRRIRPALVAVSTTFLVVAGATPALAGGGVPYDDTAVDGYIGLCDAAGNQIVSGSIDQEPFVWSAVSTKPATIRFAEQPRATLYAYQPRENVPPGQWSGLQLTGSSLYDSEKTPIAVATAGDPPLRGFIESHPLWKGWIQLRIFYSSAASGSGDTRVYPAVDIHVSGKRWTVANAQRVNCKAGHAVSSETLLLPKSKITPLPGGSPWSASAASDRFTHAGNLTSGGGSRIVTGVVIGVLAALALAVGGLMWRRRLRPPRSVTA